MKAALIATRQFDSAANDLVTADELDLTSDQKKTIRALVRAFEDESL
jgi:hypothetical protein